MSLVARAMSPDSISRDASPIVGFSNELAEIHRRVLPGADRARPRTLTRSAPRSGSHGDACRGAEMRAARRVEPTIGHTAIISRADKREGIQFTASSRRAEAQPKSM